MGRQTLITVTLLIVVYGIIQQFILTGQKEMGSSNADQYHATQERNLSLSGVEVALQKLENNPDWRNNYDPWTIQIDSEEVTMKIEDYTVNPDLKYGDLLIKASTYLDDTKDTTRTLVNRTGVLPTIFATAGFYSDTLRFDADGKAFEISGHDTNLDGTSGSAGSIYGIKTKNQAAYDSIYHELSGADGGPNQLDNITGKGGTPSMEVDQSLSTNELNKLVKKYINNADAVYSEGTYDQQTLGTDSDPQITVIDSGQTVDINGGSGTGILLIREDADLKLSSDFSYHGIIINNGILGQKSNNVQLYGGFIFSPKDNAYQSLELEGNVDLYYSTEALNLIGSAFDDFLDYKFTIRRYYE